MIPRPAIRPAQPWAFPHPVISRLDTGLTIWAYHLPGQFIVNCDLVLELPLNTEPAGQDGVATLAVRCLDEGTVAHPGEDYAAALEDTGAEFTGLVGLNTTQCLLDVPYAQLGPALRVFAEAVVGPRFDAPDVARVQANRLAEIEQQEARGAYVAWAALRAAVLAPGLRIARPGGGDAAQVAALTARDLASFHRAHYAAGTATLIVAGDLTGLDVPALVEAAFGQWAPRAGAPAPEVARPGPPQRRLIHRPGAVQADIRLGWFGTDHTDPDWASLQVALAIMGGVSSSRLNTTLREDNGYTYGVTMSAYPFRTGGLIDVVTATRLATAPAVIDTTLELLRAAEPFTPAEVRDAVGYLTLSAPLMLDTAEAVSSQAATLAAARLDLDHPNQVLRELTRVTPESALAAYRRLIDPDRASLIVVGDADELPDLGLDQTT